MSHKLPSFIKLPRNRKFEYKPMYYSEAKEEMDKMIESAKHELGLIPGSAPHKTDAFREKLKARWVRNSYGRGAKNANYRVLMVLFVIIAILWYFFK
jgi:hypothetical protein